MKKVHEKTVDRTIYEAPGTEPWEAGKVKKELVKHLVQLRKNDKHLLLENVKKQCDKKLNEYIEYIFGESDCEVVVC